MSTAVDDIMVIGDDVSVEVNGDVSVSVLVSIDVSGEDDDISFVVISSVVTEIVVSASVVVGSSAIYVQYSLKNVRNHL